MSIKTFDFSKRNKKMSEIVADEKINGKVENISKCFLCLIFAENAEIIAKKFVKTATENDKNKVLKNAREKVFV